MSILRVARMGHPVLRRVADPVPPEEISSDRIQRLVDDLLDTVEEYEGAGLAAPQVHESVRVVALTLPVADDDEDEEMQVWINPVLTPLTDDLIGSYEGCLSVPGLRGFVGRPGHIRVQALDRFGQRIDRELSGFAAIVAQHECDHLDGVLYVDRVEPGTLGFVEEMRRYGAPRPTGADDGEE
ncbi:MAG: peptide deformylase [Alphaproteobacteria bacterium]|nr:peptide deformylase [Alphaproteobacteria bacterium]